MLQMLEMYGKAMRDGVYEIFMEAAKVTELKELKEAGYEVKEFLLSPSSQWDKLMVLVHSDKIICSCSIVADFDKPDVDVKFYEALETKELLKRLARNESFRAGDKTIN